MSRRALLGAGGGVAGLWALAGCSTDGSSAAPSAPASTASARVGSWVTPRALPDGWGSGEDDGVFPRTVVHALGSTVIATAPTRVAVLSTGQVDAALTLGVVPAGSTAGDGADRRHRARARPASWPATRAASRTSPRRPAPRRRSGPAAAR